MKISRHRILAIMIFGLMLIWIQFYNITINPIQPLSSRLRSFPLSSLPVAILLQKSPVDTFDQTRRLHAIDISWAKWSSLSGGECNQYAVSIYASIGSLKSLQKEISFERIQPIYVREDDPMVRLIDGLLGILSQSQSQRWIVLANDHTFVMIPNLLHFLSSLGHSDMVYTGNILGLNTGRGTLLFASGGGGAVFSALSFKGVLLVWSLLNSDRLHSSIDRTLWMSHESEDRGNVWSAYMEKCVPTMQFSVSNTGNFSFGSYSYPFSIDIPADCLESRYLLISLKLTMELFSVERVVPYSIKFKLSDKITLTILSYGIHNRSIFVENKNSRFNSRDGYQKLFREGDLRQNCLDNSKWGLDNPGELDYMRYDLMRCGS